MDNQSEVCVVSRSHKAKKDPAPDMFDERFKDEYIRSTRTYEPYSSENIMIHTFLEIRRLVKNQFTIITPKTRPSVDDQLALLLDNDTLIFFNSSNYLATGYLDGDNYRDTLFFDHVTKNVIICRRNIMKKEKCTKGITITSKTSKSNKNHDISENEDGEEPSVNSDIRSFISGNINKIDKAVAKLNLNDVKKNKKQRKKTEITSTSIDEVDD